ncbi:hypothetical protein [Nitratifractor sp.]|uniref:hypothetical protein n=1 Tax=Nitratifractor sp. TaxID=2268144 RepID=UPI0025E8121B|nr:hypothetical protein [Nitratifractor sp.]
MKSGTMERFKKIRQERIANEYTHVCGNCHSKITPLKKNSGSFVIEIIVWVAALLLAKPTLGLSILIAFGYSVYRFTSAKTVCPVCGSENVLPRQSPAAQAILKEEDAK